MSGSERGNPKPGRGPAQGPVQLTSRTSLGLVMMPAVHLVATSAAQPRTTWRKALVLTQAAAIHSSSRVALDVPALL